MLVRHGRDGVRGEGGGGGGRGGERSVTCIPGAHARTEPPFDAFYKAATHISFRDC